MIFPLLSSLPERATYSAWWVFCIEPGLQLEICKVRQRTCASPRSTLYPPAVGASVSTEQREIPATVCASDCTCPPDHPGSCLVFAGIEISKRTGYSRSHSRARRSFQPCTRPLFVGAELEWVNTRAVRDQMPALCRLRRHAPKTSHHPVSPQCEQVRSLTATVLRRRRVHHGRA